jgi:hypothetical protein
MLLLGLVSLNVVIALVHYFCDTPFIIYKGKSGKILKMCAFLEMLQSNSVGSRNYEAKNI